jgi:NTE family protein
MCRFPNVIDRGDYQAPAEPPKASGTPFQSVVLVLQGGGALGAYQAGVYEALAERDIAPTWIAGISIGAINSAIIAGNPPAERVARLKSFWELVSASPAPWMAFYDDIVRGDLARGFVNQVAASGVMVNGAPGFFTPRFPPPALLPRGGAEATSWYDTAPLGATLERLVDFDRINSGQTRLSVGAVNVRTGNFAYFDSAKDVIRAKHIMASGALPPAFAAVEIDGESYWDGGMVSNTPLDWVLSSRSDLDTLVWQVDLWNARGALPRDLVEVAVRMKEIQFSSRTRAATDQFRQAQHLRATFHELLAKLPPELADTPQARLLAKECDPSVFNIVQLIYRSPTYEGQSKDYEFSRKTMQDHWRAGYRDAQGALAHPEVLKRPREASAVKVFDFADEHDAPAKAGRAER